MTTVCPVGYLCYLNLMRVPLVLAIIGVGVMVLALYLRSLPPVTFPGPAIEPLIISNPILPTPAPIPEVPFVTYHAPKLPQKKDYTIVLLGDSMTAALGPYADELRRVMLTKYPQIDLIIKNESAPSSNIQSLQDRLLSRSTQSGAIFDPILDKPFDIIVIESFGYNPLSYLGRTEGINKANEALLTAMRILVRERPKALVVFLATIAPSHTLYGVGAVELNLTQREEWASERDLYIENHINFALAHNIPLVDTYHLTKDKKGSGLLKYINPTDHIHPSQLGVNFIQDQLAKFFIDNKIFE